jgi:hypothetical protein
MSMYVIAILHQYLGLVSDECNLRFVCPADSRKFLSYLVVKKYDSCSSKLEKTNKLHHILYAVSQCGEDSLSIWSDPLQK